LKGFKTLLPTTEFFEHLKPLELLKHLKPLQPLNPFQPSFMQELIDKLKAEANLTDEQAKQAIATIKSYVVEKFPMLEGAVNNVFGGE
jgi:hypothetical protein